MYYDELVVPVKLEVMEYCELSMIYTSMQGARFQGFRAGSFACFAVYYEWCDEPRWLGFQEKLALQGHMRYVYL